MKGCPNKKLILPPRRSTADSSSSMEFFYFPIDRDIQLKWLDFCKNDKIKDKPPQTVAKYMVCEKHFSMLQFRFILGPFKKKLKAGAVPDIGLDGGQTVLTDTSAVPTNKSIPISSEPQSGE